MRVINWTWSSIRCRERWTTWYMSMNKPVNRGITWVFSLLIVMTSCVFCMRSLIYRRIGWSMESRRFGRRKRKSGWLTWSWRKGNGNCKFFGRRFPRSPILPTKWSTWNTSSTQKRKRSETSQNSSKTRSSIPTELIWEVRTPTLRPCKPRFKCLKSA